MEIYNLKYSRRLVLIICLGIISLGEYVFGIFNTNYSLTNLYIFQVLIIYILGVIECVKRLGIYHLFTLITFLFFVFVLGGIAVTPFFDYSIRVAISPDYQEFPEQVTQKSLLIFCVFFASIYYFFFHNYRVSSCTINMGDNEYRRRLFKLGRWMIIIIFPFALYYGYIMFTSDARTTMFIDGGASAPFYLRIAHMLFTIAFFFIVASVPSMKQFLFCFAMYIIALVPVLMAGERGEIVVPIIFLVWYLNKCFNYKINIKILAIIASAIMVLSFVVTYTRHDEVVENTNLSFLLFGFLASSCTSFKLMSWYIFMKDHLPSYNYPFFLDSLIGGILPASGQKLETLEIRSSIGHQLVYAINPEYYLAGGSMGTAFVTEGYEFGIIGVILAAYVFVVFVKFVEDKMWLSRIGCFFLYYEVELLLLSPRGSFLPGIYDLLKYGGVATIILFCFNLSFWGKKKKDAKVGLSYK